MCIASSGLPHSFAGNGQTSFGLTELEVGHSPPGPIESWSTALDAAVGDGVGCALTRVVGVGVSARVVDDGVGDDMGGGVTELRFRLPSLEFEYLGQGWLNLPPLPWCAAVA